MWLTSLLVEKVKYSTMKVIQFWKTIYSDNPVWRPTIINKHLYNKTACWGPISFVEIFIFSFEAYTAVEIRVEVVTKLVPYRQAREGFAEWHTQKQHTKAVRFKIGYEKNVRLKFVKKIR